MNVEKLITSSEYRELYKALKLGQDANLTLDKFTNLLQENINLSDRNEDALLFHNKEFFKYIKTALVSSNIRFQFPESLTEEMVRFSSRIGRLVGDGSNGRNRGTEEDFRGLEIKKKSDFKDLARFNSFSGTLLIKLCQPNIEFGGFFETMDADKIRSKWRAKEFTWLGNFTSIKGFEDEERNLNCMKNIKNEFYQMAEIEGLCPFEMQNMLLQKILFKGEKTFFDNMDVNHRRKKIFLFDIIFDDELLKELPKLKETKRDVYDGLLESAVYYIIEMNKQYNVHYLSNIQYNYEDVKGSEYTRGKVEKFESMLNKFPRDILSVEIIDNWEVNSLIKLLPKLEKFKRENDLLEQFDEINKNNNSAERTKKKI